MRIIYLPLAMLVLLCACTLFRGTDKAPGSRSVAWQERDSKRAAKELASRMISSGWYREFTAKSKRTPLLVLGAVSYDPRIASIGSSFMKALENELVAAGISLVARRDDPAASSPTDDFEAEMVLARSTGADFILRSSIADAGQLVIPSPITAYEISINLVRVDNGAPVWSLSNTYTAGSIPDASMRR